MHRHGSKPHFVSISSVALWASYLIFLQFSFLFSEADIIIILEILHILNSLHSCQRAQLSGLTHTRFNCSFLPTLSTSENLKNSKILDVCEAYISLYVKPIMSL